MTKFLKLSDQAFANYATLLKSLTDITELLSTMRVNTKQVCEEVPTAEVHSKSNIVFWSRRIAFVNQPNLQWALQ